MIPCIFPFGKYCGFLNVYLTFGLHKKRPGHHQTHGTVISLQMHRWNWILALCCVILPTSDSLKNHTKAAPPSSPPLSAPPHGFCLRPLLAITGSQLHTLATCLRGQKERVLPLPAAAQARCYTGRLWLAGRWKRAALPGQGSGEM